MTDKDEVNVTFFYQRRTVNIHCKVTEQLKEIFKKFIYKINPSYSLKEFDFYYEDDKLDDDSKNLSEIISGDNNINLSAERKLRIIKCPECICNDCIINEDNYRLIFYGCKYNHIVSKLLNEYDQSQKVNFSQIVCNKNGCNEKMSDNFQDFYKCLTCSKIMKHTYYLCNKHSSKKEHDEAHVTVRYDDKNYYCENHYQKFIEYCFKCKTDLCRNCLDDHNKTGHLVKSYESLAPNLEDIRENLNSINEKIGNLRCSIDSIKESLDGALKMYENYYKIATDITEKYENYNKDFKNYRVLRNFLNLKKTNKKIKESLEDILQKNTIEKIDKLIKIYKGDREIYNSVRKEESFTDKDGLEEYKEWEEEKAINESNKDNSLPNSEQNQ